MLRFLHVACLAPVLVFSLAGCATTPAASSSSANYAMLTYDGVSFRKPGLRASQQIASFRPDIDACEAPAQKNYLASLASSSKLSAIYGQPITPEKLLAMKKVEVIDCMTGNVSKTQGKGWVVSQ